MTTPQKPWRARTRVTASAVALLIGSSAALVACGNEPDENTVAKLLPENTLAFTSAAISPSNKQKLSLFELSKHLPSKVQTEKADDVRDKLIAQLFEGSDLNYEADVKPWLGSEAAGVVLPSYTDDHVPVVVTAVKQTDKDKAQAALDKTKQPANTYRFIDDYLFFIDEAQITEQNASKALDDITALAKDGKKSLQNNERFKNDLGQLHGEHLVIGWVDTPAVAREGIAAVKFNKTKDGGTAESQLDDLSSIISGIGYTKGTASVKPAQAATSDDALAGSLLGGTALGLLDSAQGSKIEEDAYTQLQKSADEVGSFSFELYATSDSLVLEGVTEKEPADIGQGTEKKIFSTLPNDTLGAFTVSDFGKSMKDLLTELNKNGTDDTYVTEFKPSIDKLVGALGSEAAGFIQSGDPTVGGVVVELKDAAAAQSAIDELVNKFKPSGYITVKDLSLTGGKGYDIQPQTPSASDYSFDETTGEIKVTPGKTTPSSTHVFIGIANNRLAITNASAQLTAAIDGSGDLGNQAPVKKALADQKLVFGAFYINLEQVVALAEKQGEDISNEDAEWLKSLDVAGTQAWTKDSHYHTELRLGLK